MTPTQSLHVGSYRINCQTLPGRRPEEFSCARSRHDRPDPEAGELGAAFDGRTVTYGFGELDALVPAYAATIHKSQGSEYPAEVIPVLTQHYAMLQRNLLYTGVTRGKRLVVLVGQKKAVAIAVRNVSGRRRWSKLDEWLGGETDEIAGPRAKGGRHAFVEVDT